MSEKRTVYAVCTLDVDTGKTDREIEEFVENHLKKILIHHWESVAVKAFPRLMSIADMNKVYEGMHRTVETIDGFSVRIDSLKQILLDRERTFKAVCEQAENSVGTIEANVIKTIDKTVASKLEDACKAQKRISEELKRVHERLDFLEQIKAEKKKIQKRR